MKHIKFFESNSNVVEVATVRFGNDIHALYIDGVLEIYGDYYHDKIEYVISGFISGLKWIKKGYIYPLEVKESKFRCLHNSIVDDLLDGKVPPKNLSEINDLLEKY